MKKLLIAQDLKNLMMSAIQSLQRSEISVVTTATNDDILKNHLTEPAHMIVTQIDTPGMTVETLVHTIRRGQNLRKVSILLLCDNTPAQQDRCVQCGANAVVTRPIDPAVFAERVHELLDVAPRRYYRVVLNAEVEGQHKDRPFLCSSQNLSTKGMLIRTQESLAPGERISCSFCLPDGKRLRAAGEIVRVVHENSGSDVNHYGIRFSPLTPDAESAISVFVAQELKHPPGKNPLSSELQT